MKIEIKAKELLQALNAVVKVVPNKAINPMHENLLLEGDGIGLTITCTNDAFSVENYIICDCKGKMVVPAKTFTDIITRLGDAEVRIESEENTCKIVWAKGEMSVGCFKPEDFPIFSENKGGKNAVKFTAEEFENALANTFPCVAEDDLRPIMGGVYVDSAEDSVVFVGTDAHVLMTSKVGKKEPFASLVIPKYALNLLKGNIQGDVEITSDEKNIYINCGSTLIIARKVEGKFPNYSSIFPKHTPNKFVTDRKAFLATLHRVSACSNKSTQMLKFTLSESECKVEAQDLGFQLSAKETLEGHYEGADLTIGFKSTLLETIVKCLDTNEVTFLLDTPSKAALVYGETDNAKGIIMPALIEN